MFVRRGWTWTAHAQRCLDCGKDRSELSLLRRASSRNAKTVRNMRGQGDGCTVSLLATPECMDLFHDTQTDILPGYPESAICVQRFDDSLHSAIHITYRNWLRSSSMHEPRDPPLEVVSCLFVLRSVGQQRDRRRRNNSV